MSDQHHIALPAGYRLENYRLDSVLGHGGFGITYQAVDEDLQQVMAIKEYLPREVAFRDRDSTVIPLSEGDREVFEWGLERFLDEARTLARFRHPSIVGVRRFIRANGTAYLVMDYCDGESLESVLAREGTLAPERLGAMLVPLLNALEALHAAGVTHRDIKPGNLYLREDGSPVLLDFGAARQALAQHSRSVTAMATPGYAAFEQYSTKGKQGPWTDIYGLGATLYRCVTGQRPPDASDRMLEDDLVPTVEMASGRYPKPLLQQIDAALKLRPQDRPQSVHDWRRLGSTGSTPMAEPIGVSAKDAIKAKRQETGDVPEPVEVARTGRWWVWPLVVASMFVFFSLWLGSEQLNQGPEPSATATRDSAAPARLEPPPEPPAPEPSATAIDIEELKGGSEPSPAPDAEFSLEYSRCMNQSGGVTSSMLDCMGQEHDRQDARLNRVYTNLMEKLSGEREERRTVLRDAQRAWLKYREANCEFYHNPDGGTMAMLIAYDCFMSETAKRAKELEDIQVMVNVGSL